MKKALKWVGICLGVLVGIVLLSVGTLFVMNQWTGDTKPIIAMANRFKPAAGWTLSGESIQPPRMYCVGNVPCPMLARSWETHQPLNRESFVKFVTDAGLSTENIDCLDPPENLGRDSTYCSTEESLNGYYVEVFSTQNDDIDNSSISIYIKEETRE